MLQKQLSKIGTKTTGCSAIIVKDNKILLGLRHYGPTKVVWTTPGGRCDEGESIEQSLRREVEEETGINDLEIEEYIGVYPGAKEGDDVYTFLCETDQKPELKEPEKFSEWRWLDIKDFAAGEPKNFINEKSRKQIAGFLKKDKS